MADIPYFTHNANGKLIEIPCIDDLCTMLKEKFNDLEEGRKYLYETIADLREENYKLKENLYKDEDYAKTKTELEELRLANRRGFPMSEDECLAVDDWMEKHNKKHKGEHPTAIGGRYTFKFIPTTIGIVGEVSCICGEEFTFRELE